MKSTQTDIPLPSGKFRCSDMFFRWRTKIGLYKIIGCGWIADDDGELIDAVTIQEIETGDNEPKVLKIPENRFYKDAKMNGFIRN